MKKICIFLFLTLLFLSTSATAIAQTPPAPNPAPAPETPNELTDTQQNSQENSIDATVNNFISSFDWISSGLIFSTPNLLQETITLGDQMQITGIDKYRNIFSDLAIPFFVIITSFIALSHITHDNSYQLKTFIKRMVFVIFLAVLTPYILSYSIEFINLLNNKINSTISKDLVSFITDYTKNGDLSKLFSFSMNPLDFFSNFWGIMTHLIVMIISLGFLLIGFLYIVFQAVIRFISLLFLSVIFPIVIPFALSEKTEEIVNTFFRVWCTLLIQQPAFILGFAIVSAILTSILNAHGGSIGVLFVYSGALFFLGGVNMFVGRIFGDGWTLLSTNAKSMMASGAITGFGRKTISEVKRGAIAGRASGIRSYAGAYLGNRIRSLSSKNKQEEAADFQNGERKSLIKTNNKFSNDLPHFSKEARDYGFRAETIDEKKGLVRLKGNGYSYTDPKSNLTTTYLSKEDAIASGRKDEELKPTPVNHLVIDHSKFNKENPISYKSNTAGKKSYLGQTGYSNRIKEYLESTKESDANGLLMKHYEGKRKGKMKAPKKTLRIYSKKPL